MKRDNNVPFLGMMLLICLVLVTCTAGRVMSDPYQQNPENYHEAR